MENDNSDATQIMVAVSENEITTTETPKKPKRTPSTARNEHWPRRALPEPRPMRNRNRNY